MIVQWVAVGSGYLVVLAGTVAALWRFGTRVHDNTSALQRLTSVVEGAAGQLGLNARVRSLEEWKIAFETEQRVRHEIEVEQ